MMNVLALVAVLLFQAGAASRPGVITGRVMTGDGTPAVKVRVAATPADATNTGSPDSALLGITETDEQGNYRLEGLAPGQYRVVAGLLEWLTYYPGAKESTGATAIQITPGVTRPGTNFTLQRPVSVRVRGRLVRLNPRATLPNQITLSTSGNGNYQQLNTSVAADGAFEFPRVTPGSYQMQMNPYVTGVTLPPVNVTDKDVEGIEVKIPLVTNVRGKVVVEDGAPVPRMNIAFISERGRLDAGASVDGSFSISATEGEHRLVVSNVPGGYALRSMSSGSTDLLRQPLKVGEAEITDLVLRFSGPPPEMLVRLRGKVVRPAGNTGPVPNKIQLSGTNLPNLEAVIAPDGSFEYPKLLPGAYSVNLQPRNTPMPPLSINLIRDMDAFEITLPREFEVSGSVVVEQDGPQPQFSIRTTNAVTSNGSGNVYAQNGTFKIVLTEGEHRFNFQGLSNG
jgi:protocatechuate 3,4-dioxygenase beta subunit